MSKSINPTKCHFILYDCRGFLEKESDIISEWKNLHQSNPKSNNANSEAVTQNNKLETNINENDVKPTRNKCNKVVNEVIENKNE